ncbi:hypothetical protein PMIT1342_00345 [Prochlorococcus marinus str. MIT 1342]|uniref:hypothetical protein n=1 Tax=Prochlorococcus TaxID=1218 RepID=UPI0007B3E464|nr:hypothetical protein [Prochlorococcus marinus]KZR83553.1 hypothetical protein PMIT1342_00345 [Prochlorococcus marinus str. MIT 1342]
MIEEFIAEVQKNDENEDLELSEAELAAVSGGFEMKGRKIVAEENSGNETREEKKMSKMLELTKELKKERYFN